MSNNTFLQSKKQNNSNRFNILDSEEPNKKPYIMTQDLIMPLSVIEFIGKEEIKQLATNNVNELLNRGEQSPLKQYVLFYAIHHLK